MSSSSSPVTHQHLIDLFQAQNAKFDSIERQMEKVTEVLTRIALLEERRTQDREQIEHLRQEIDHLEHQLGLLKDVQQTKFPPYDEMLGSYTKFKNVVIGAICSGLLAAVLLATSIVDIKLPFGKQ